MVTLIHGCETETETVDDIMFVVVFFVHVHLCVTLFSLLYFLAVMFWYFCSGGNLMSLRLIKWNSVSCSVHRVSFNLSICKRLCFHTNTQTHTPAWWQENAWCEKRRDVMSLSNDGWVILACDSTHECVSHRNALAEELRVCLRSDTRAHAFIRTEGFLMRAHHSWPHRSISQDLKASYCTSCLRSDTC